MNRTEHLLTCLAEECAEVTQAVAKALRFGLADGYPGTDRTNAGDIENEINDILAIVSMLQDDGSIRAPMSRDQSVKKMNVEKFMRYAEKRGTLTGAGRKE